MYIRLVGCSGEWTDYSYGTSPHHVQGCVFTLRAPYSTWKQVISGDLHPVKGIVQGKVSLSGHLPEVLKWTPSIMILAEVASRLDTVFVDER
jgi:putative sterol carrier protein